MTKLTIPALTMETAYTHPIMGNGLGPYSHAVLGDLGGLTQFGVHIEVLPPGSRSSFRHWHETEDEMILMISGEVTSFHSGSRLKFVICKFARTSRKLEWVSPSK